MMHLMTFHTRSPNAGSEPPDDQHKADRARLIQLEQTATGVR